MDIAVFGLGYVGCVSAACLADLGHSVIGVDVNPRKLEMLRQGHPPIIEPDLDALVADAVSSGRLTVTDSTERAVDVSALSMVCVGTPSRPNGSLDMRDLDRVIGQIGSALSGSSTYHVVAVRSTLLPGVFSDHLVPRLEATSRRTSGETVGMCLNPEFLREGTAIKDFRSPPFTLIGATDGRSGDLVASVYTALEAPIYRVQPDAAAMVKYASNAYHGLKIAFANEIGAVCRAHQINSREVMDIFAEDRYLNVSAAYLQPGFAFGGSCLPKDIRALVHAASHRDVQVPLLSAILPSNDRHIQRAVDLLIGLDRRRIALLGLSFKPGTDDLRESPMVRLAETLIGKGFRLKIYDEEVSMSTVFGRNREYIEKVLPHVGELLCGDLRTILTESEVLVIGKRFQKLDQICPAGSGHIVVDLTRSGSSSLTDCLSII